MKNQIDAYIKQFPDTTQTLLQQLRNCIAKAAPKATEVLSYGMPAFKTKSVLVYYAAYKNHIGFYPHTSPIKFFAKELAPYKTSKGAIQFPLDAPLPLTLIKTIVKFRLQEEALKENSVSHFTDGLSNPAKRALANANITSLKKLASFTEKEILKLHGIGPASLPVLRAKLMEANLSFKK
jgi:uncharacterized protein YdhG (YjbR/CyaY superfamily)